MYMHIGLTYDLQTDSLDERQAEFDSPSTIIALRRALEELGHRVVMLGNAHELLRRPGWMRQVEIVFNIAEGTHGRCREAWVPTVLELLGVPYVGSDPLALTLGLDKVMSKRLAREAGVLTPPWISVDHPRALPSRIPLRFPLMVKPRYEGSGRGIDQGAVVQDGEALRARVEWLIERCPEPVLIEEFIPEGELTICLIGNDPVVAYPPIQRPLDPSTRLSSHVATPAPRSWSAPLVLDHGLETAAREMALAMFRALTCRDVARIDARVDGQGRVQFLEINPLPSFDPEDGFGLLAESLGISYPVLVGRVLDAALRRLEETMTVRPQRTTVDGGRWTVDDG